jgi:hypothetical protein
MSSAAAGSVGYACCVMLGCCIVKFTAVFLCVAEGLTSLDRELRAPHDFVFLLPSQPEERCWRCYVHVLSDYPFSMVGFYGAVTAAGCRITHTLTLYQHMTA